MNTKLVALTVPTGSKQHFGIGKCQVSTTEGVLSTILSSIIGKKAQLLKRILHSIHSISGARYIDQRERSRRALRPQTHIIIRYCIMMCFSALN